jgi:hypothetical protein
MKTIIPLTALAALVASSTIHAQTPAYSKPSGYVTQTLQPGFNLVGINLVKSRIVSGSFTALDNTSVQVGTSDLSVLTAGLHLLEITSGSAAGRLTEFTVWSGNTITTVDNLQAANVAIGDTFLIRKAPTLEEVFGTTASVLNRNNNSANADIVWVPNGSGGYNRYFLNNSSVWRNALGGAAPNIPIVYLDGLFVERKGSTSASLVITGEVKTTFTSIALGTGFNLIGTIFPSGSTLQNSGLDATLVRNNNSANADIVWIPTGPGTYARYFLNNAGAWRNALGGAAASDLPLTSSIFVQRKGSGTVTTNLTPPSSYTNL